MTALSRSSFNTLNANGDAVEHERRVFRTAGGIIQEAVYSVPEFVATSKLYETQSARIA